MKTVNYKGYQASVEFEDGTLFVKVLHIDDLLVAEVDRASDAQKALEDLIEAYLLDCAEEGREPTQPFKGSFNVRLGPELHKRAAMRAADEGMTLNKWICVSIDEKLECGKLSERIDGVFSKSKAHIDAASIAQWTKIITSHAGSDASHEYGREVRLNFHRWNDESQDDQALLRRVAKVAPRAKFDA
ncbi:hypothetical protein QWE_18358 [Agrobacterium albertimagni AOL15]|uniref:HicB family protein n=1 Tax=Agrobacterium albertimagni AOL15 TaxID=1156935 RepID=K2Q0H7_9HYPH|nr:type II toxin-antitoxin system HicB family antitoxin [Agrobacterium albertimagni]EKF58590.1 hypothetical protein QWE_18358 [Agrobacterium albertimagni AOL15]